MHSFRICDLNHKLLMIFNSKLEISVTKFYILSKSFNKYLKNALHGKIITLEMKFRHFFCKLYSLWAIITVVKGAFTHISSRDTGSGMLTSVHEVNKNTCTQKLTRAQVNGVWSMESAMYHNQAKFCRYRR